MDVNSISIANLAKGHVWSECSAMLVKNNYMSKYSTGKHNQQCKTNFMTMISVALTPLPTPPPAALKLCGGIELHAWKSNHNQSLVIKMTTLERSYGRTMQEVINLIKILCYDQRHLVWF